MCWVLPLLARLDRFTDFCKEPGLSAWWKRSGPSSPCAGGGKLRTPLDPELSLQELVGMSHELRVRPGA